MTLHDAAMTRFSQWWQREIRSGYVFAQGAHLHGAPPEYHFAWESARAWFWGGLLPLACLCIGWAFRPWGWTAWLIYPLHMLQKVIRSSGPLKDRALIALFHVVGHFAQNWGQIRFMRDRPAPKESSSDRIQMTYQFVAALTTGCRICYDVAGIYPLITKVFLIVIFSSSFTRSYPLLRLQIVAISQEDFSLLAAYIERFRIR